MQNKCTPSAINDRRVRLGNCRNNKRRSIFYRPPQKKSPEPPEPETTKVPELVVDDTCDECSNTDEHDIGYESSEEDNTDWDFWEDVESKPSNCYEEQTLVNQALVEQGTVGLCQALPFSHCYYMEDAQDFIYSQVDAPHMLVRPVTEPAYRDLPGYGENRHNMVVTSELVNTLMEYLGLIYHVDVCVSTIPLDKRLPHLTDFIWDILDGFFIDMWTGITCNILLRRYLKIRSGEPMDGEYGAVHKLFLGILMCATMNCIYNKDPIPFSISRLTNSIDTHLKYSDLLAIRDHTLKELHYRTWVTREDIDDYGANNQFDIYRMKSAHLDLMERQRLRDLWAAQERERELEHERICKELDKFMYRTPHDSLGSWNKETMYCTEKRFLFRHLPWFRGVGLPFSVRARDERIKDSLLCEEFKPVFSPLLPPLRRKKASQ